MEKLIGWVKQNKLAAFLLVIIIFLIFPQILDSVTQRRVTLMGVGGGGENMFMKVGLGGSAPSYLPSYPQPESPPAPEVKDRLVIRESNLSLLVKSVRETQKLISQKTQQLGGYMVTSYVSHPEEAEAANGSITVRVPQDKLEEAIDYFRNLAVRVVSENLSGQDVTDEYVDIEARLATLLKTKARFEEIMARTEKVEEILQIQRELINLQEQIDSLKGRQNYLEKSAQMSKVTAYLSTDELSLPYAPTEAWRPTVIFKQAVRSLIGALRDVGTALIWLGVYSVIWVPILGLIIFWRRRKSLKTP